MNVQSPLTADFVQTVEAPQMAPAPAQPSAIAGVIRAMRGKWGLCLALSTALGGALGTAGYMTGTQTYESRAILRIYPKESKILYASADDSVLKTYQSYVKAETSFVASHGVMTRAADQLRADFPVLAADMSVQDLSKSVSVRRSESLIVLESKSKDPDFVAAKLDAVTSAYLSLTNESKTRQADLRKAELTAREQDLFARLQQIDARTLEVGGEYGADAMMKAHFEKIAHIDSLAARKSELAGTLASMRADAGVASADMNDEHILRATLLDRGIADLNIELARTQAELAQLRERFSEEAYQVRQKKTEIFVLEEAMTARRTQIQVLGQTGALTDQSNTTDEESIAALQQVFDKVSDTLDRAREEALDLNARRIELSFLEEERLQVRTMLDTTRRALDVIRVESGQALPGLTDLMSPAVRPNEPSEDSAKLQAAGGLFSGGALASILVLGLAMAGRRFRWSDDVQSNTLKTLAVLPAKQADTARAMDRLRNRVMLSPAREERVEAGRVLAVARPDAGDASTLALDLAESFARARLRVALVDADMTRSDLTTQLGLNDRAGWREHLEGDDVTLCSQGDLSVLPAGDLTRLSDGSVSPMAMRAGVARLAQHYDVVILKAGSLSDSVTADLTLSVSDFAIADVAQGDHRSTVQDRLDQFDRMPRNGGGIVFRGAAKRDPALTA